MNNYAESKKILDKIRNDFNQELVFRNAIRWIIDCGQQAFMDEDWVDAQCKMIDDRHDEIEAKGKCFFITRDCEKAMVKCAEKIAQVNNIHLVMYLQREVWFYDDSNDIISYKDAISLVKHFMKYITEYDCGEYGEVLNALYDIGFTDTEIEALGYGYLFNEEEE